MTLGSSIASRRERGARRLPAWSAGSCLVLLVAVSRAEPVAADAERAERLFDEGRAAMAEQRFDVACGAFAESQKLDPAAGTLVNWGACLEAQGKNASAVEAYRASLASTQPGTDGERERFVGDRIAALEPRLCSVTVAVPPKPPAGTQVLLDAT